MNRRNLITMAGAGLFTAHSGSAQSDKINAAILGTKHSHTGGKLKAMQDSPHYRVVGVCENDTAARAKAQANSQFAGLKWMSEEEMLHDSSIQLIVVECNVWEAIPWGNKVIAAGKHLHIEKPVGNNWAEFKGLVDAARKKNLLFQTGYVWRWNEGVVKALEIARNGWLGDVYLVRGTMNADRDADQRAVEAKYRGGGMFELGGHVIDRVVDLLGRPNKVQSWLKHGTSVKDTLADNNVAVFEYDRALAVISQSAKMAGANDHRSLELVGTDGTVMVWPESNPPRMRIYLRAAQGPYKAGWQDINLPPQPRFVGDFAELARALKSHTPLKLSYEHELLLQETLLRASGEIPA